jgi:hypothetical protein
LPRNVAPINPPNRGVHTGQSGAALPAWGICLAIPLASGQEVTRPMFRHHESLGVGLDPVVLLGSVTRLGPVCVNGLSKASIVAGEDPSSENNATSEFSSLTLFSWNTVLPLNLRSLSPSGNSLPLAVLSCLHPNQLKGVAPSAIQAAQQRLQTALQDWLPRKNINWPNFTSAYAHADICLKPEVFSSRQATCWTTWNIAVDESANKHKKSIRLGNIHRIQHIGQVKQKKRECIDKSGGKT